MSRWGDDPLVELGEDMALPADWRERKSYLDTDFDSFAAQDGQLRLYHHVNSLFLLYLSPAHPLHAHPLRDSVRFVYTEASLGILAVAGKRRKGAPQVRPATVFASLELSDGTTFPLEACIKGAVQEVNERLVANPRMLLQDTDEAYLGGVCRASA